MSKSQFPFGRPSSAVAHYDSRPMFPQPDDAPAHILFEPEGVPLRAYWLPKDEDTGFNLNIYAPQDIQPDERLPVLVSL